MQNWLSNFAMLGATCGSTIHTTPSTYGVPKVEREALMAHMKAIWRHNPCCLAGQQGGYKTKSGHGPLAMMGPTCGQTTYITPTILRCTGNVDRRKAAYITPAALLGWDKVRTKAKVAT